MVLLPTFPILRAGESHYREKTKFPKQEKFKFMDIGLCEYFSPMSVLFLDGTIIIGTPERKLDLSMIPMFLE